MSIYAFLCPVYVCKLCVVPESVLLLCVVCRHISMLIVALENKGLGNILRIIVVVSIFYVSRGTYIWCVDVYRC